MGQRRAVVHAVADVQGHRLGDGKEERRLVHVVPETGGAHVCKALVQATPPVAHARQRKVWKDAVAGPYRTDVGGPVGTLDEYVFFRAGIVGRVAVVGVFLDVQIRDQDRMDALHGQIGDHFFESGKFGAIDGKGSVFVLIVDIEVNRIQRNLFVAEGFGNFKHTGFRLVAVARLLESQSPKRRQFHPAYQRREIFDDFFWRRTGKEIVVDLSTF